MRQGSFTLDNLMKYIYGEQISKIPAKMYNDDAQVKYLDFGSLYTYCCHGSKEHQIRRWLRERIAYVDSMLGYFTSQEDQVTIRMNKTGSVSFDVTPYIPLYFSVKWSNATGGTQTFKLKRGETKTFNYSSTTSTDQEVIIYHAKYIKRLDNLSNLNPSSCILSNAVKLTNVEIHSSELYNINVTNNKFLRSINLENCTALGTVTATGSSLNLSNCKYLRYCNVYNTHLTEVQLNTSGGSLTEIYYPKSIQSINLVKQRLLELVGLPYGEKGSEIPTSLYTISIQECPSITKLNTSSDTTIASSFASMVYVNNLTIRNSLDLASLKFDGFHRLQNVTIENMYNLEEVGFNNLLPVGETSTIKYIGMSNCPKLGTIELNCTSNDYEITFADDAILNFGGLFKLNSITSNCVLKGIKTIVVPINLESMFFTNEYGSGYSTIENIWVSSQCNVDTQATTPIVTHVDSTYSGIDFLGMNLKNIDLGALVNIPKAINFKLSPTTVNPHFNLNRDGETYKYLQPVGTLDLSNYTESLAKFFDGVDLDKLEIICNNNLPQTDLSYCFYNSSFSTNEAINKLLTKVSSITNLDYCFYKTTIDSVDILDEINMGASSSMNYTFAECPNIKTLNNVVIPSKVTSVEGMFNKCPLTTITNMVVNVRGSISGLFKGCNKLTTITTLRIPNVTDVSNTFDGCTSLSSLSGFELPSSCTNVSNLFNGCYMLTELGMEFGANITAGDNWYPPNLETLHDTTISNDYVKLTNCTTLKTLNNVNISGGDLSDLFNGCINLANINKCTFNATTSLARAFKGCSKITINPITTIVDTVTDISEIYNGCTGITDISGMTFGSGISYGGTSSSDWYPPNLTTANNVTIKCEDIWFNGCSTLVQCRNLNLQGVTNLNYYFANCSNVTEITFNPNSQFSKIKSMGSCFSSCSKLSNVDVSIIPKTNTSTLLGCFSRCSSLTSITLGIPDTCTNIQGLFQMSGVTDISGSVFGSGITNATNWQPPGLTTANNITMKNDNTKFTDCSTLVSCTNFKITSDVTELSETFKNCSNLTSFSFSNESDFSNLIEMLETFKNDNSLVALNLSNIVCTSKLVSMNELCGNCSSLTALYLPSNLQDSSITVLNGVAPSCRKLKTVYNLYLPDGFVEFGNYAFGWVGTIELKDTIDVIGFRVPNTTDPSKVFAKVYKMFKSFSNVIWSETATSIAGMFQGLIHLTHDLEIPSHITDCSNAFKGCTSMTHVHSNWNNTYTNGITSTDCYSGCTGITHIDDENVIAYEGDSGIDYIPKDWGGYGFDVDHSSIYEITTTADNTEVRLLYYHYQFVYSVDGVYYNSENSISWGDGEYHTVPNSSTDSDGTVRPGIFGSTSFPAHTYAKAGTYYMKGNFIPKTYGNGPGAPYVTRVLRVAKKCVNTSRSTGIRTETPIENMEKYFENLTNVTYINATNLITSTTKKVVNMFKNCQKLVTIDGMNTWDCSNIVNVSGMFYLCKSLTQLDLNMFNYSIIDDFINFLNACSSLTNLDFSNFKINTIRSCDGIFYGLGMSELTLDNSGVDKYVNLYRSMNFLPNATSVTLKNFKLSSLKQQFYAGCTKLTSVSYINCTMSDTCDVNEYTFNNLPIVNFDFTGTEITVDLLLNRNSAISHESLVNIITNLKDYSSGDTHTLTIGSTNLAKLTTDEITIATNKNWTVV